MNKVTKAVIPAAGLGTRFLPITKAVPKPMLSVLDKPTIQYIIEELDALGFNEIIVIISPNSDVIEKHFGKNKDLEERLLSDGKTALYKIAKKTRSFSVRFVVQPTPNGLAGALLCAEEYIKGEPFALLLGDELLYAKEGQTSCIKDLLETYEKTSKSVIATMEVFGDDVSKYGNIGIKSETDGIIEVSEIVEKPSLAEALSNNAIIGRYVFSGEIIGMLKNLKPTGNEIYLTDALTELAKQGKLLARTINCERFDVGDKVGYIKANVEMALISTETKEEIKEYVLELAKRL